MNVRSIVAALWMVFSITASLAAQTKPADPLRFSISLDPGFTRETMSGRIILLLTDELVGEPRTAWSASEGQYVFSLPVSNISTGSETIIDDTTPGFPVRMSELPPRSYNIQAIMDANPDDPEFGFARGNGRSRPIRVELNYATSGRVEVSIEKEITRNKFVDLPRLRYHRIESRQIGRTKGHRVYVDVAVLLPRGKDGTGTRKYPVQYWIPPFGQGARGALNFFQSRGCYEPRHTIRSDMEDFIRVLIDPRCKNGHHMWVDSENNGPWMQALMTEIIPAIEKMHPVIAEPRARFLVGHGSGGWSALWLQINRPDFFGGVWATAPDPLDFHSFLGMDLYASPPPNLFSEADGKTRAVVVDGEVIMDFKTQSLLDRVLGRGTLLHCWQSNFGGRTPEGAPASLYDPNTGGISRDVVGQWARFDILGLLRRRWLEIANDLQGKLHLYAGAMDPIASLDSVRNLKIALEEWNSDAHVEILENHGHSSLSNRDMQEKIQVEISNHWRATRK